MNPLLHPDEFPPGASEWPETLSRRRFIELMAASLAFGGGACTRQPREKIVPYVRQPEALTLGKSLFFATAMPLGGDACGLLVRSDSGRPTKIEGNPLHPASLGRSSVHMQAALLTLYDPARSQMVTRRGAPATWEELLGALMTQRAQWQSDGGAGLRLLTRRSASPTGRAQMARLLAQFPRAKWHEHDAAFPRRPQPARARLDGAEVIVALDAELFGLGGWDVAAALAFARQRRAENGMNRLYAVESAPSLTGSMADHRLALPPSGIVALARELAEAVKSGAPSPDSWVGAVARDLQKHRGRSVVIAGDFQPPEVHELAYAMNVTLGNIGATVEDLADDEPAPGTLAELVQAMAAGEVTSLIVAGPNPIYDAPADLDFAGALGRVPFTLHHGLYADETAARCEWHVPESHFLESWSDARAAGGAVSIVQPLIEPLYPSKTVHELLAGLLAEIPSTSYEIIRAAWRAQLGEEGFETAWRKALHDGVVALPPRTAVAKPDAAAPRGAPSVPAPRALELLIRPDPHLLDGRFSENAWLQELPNPFTKLTWENAAQISPQTATRLGLAHGDVVELRYRGRAVRAPLWVMPTHAEECVSIHLGHGRARGGDVAGGFNAFLLQTSDAPWSGAGLEIHATGARHDFATTQSHQRMEGREPVRVTKAGQTPVFSGGPPVTPDTSLYPKVEYGRPAWGMVIDLTACIGCAACTVACQAENNIPVVGREQVLAGREMHWIRVDRYFDAGAEGPRMLHQPVPCMHCENAPCELVCPVGATVHDREGLNVMVYNRCVGTRYCSNNCPYKVRRFNFLHYTDDAPQLALMRNPDVTVRMRGVMEKCTYCIQRISAARIEAQKETRAIRDGEVTPACAQACPAEAIVFGDILDPASRVAALRQDTRHYALLGELNTRPRTTYLARVLNPNPEMT